MQHVEQIFFQGNRWNVNDLTTIAGAPNAITQTALATYVLPNSVQAVVYIDRTQHIDQIFFQASQWLINDLTILAHAPPATLGSSLATYVLPTAVQAVAFVDQSKHVDQMFYQGNQWLTNDLTAMLNAPVSASSSSLATYVLPNGVQAIAYVDQNENVDQFFFQGNQWNFNDLTLFNNTPTVVPGSSLATYVLPDGVQAIAFIDNNGHVDQLFFQGGTWNFNDLSAIVNAPVAATSSPLRPLNPLQEFIYLNQHLIAIENRQ
jgi:hypothetical protein